MFVSDNDFYNHLQKPSADVEVHANCGATFVDVADSFIVNRSLIVNQAMFARDTDSPQEQIAQRQQLYVDLIISVVHPCRPCGASPIPLKSLFNFFLQPLTGGALHILIHCDILMKNCTAQNDDLLYKLLRFSKYCARQSRNNSTISNARNCECALNDELQNA